MAITSKEIRALRGATSAQIQQVMSLIERGKAGIAGRDPALRNIVNALSALGYRSAQSRAILREVQAREAAEVPTGIQVLRPTEKVTPIPTPSRVEEFKRMIEQPPTDPAQLRGREFIQRLREQPISLVTERPTISVSKPVEEEKITTGRIRTEAETKFEERFPKTGKALGFLEEGIDFHKAVDFYVGAVGKLDPYVEKLPIADWMKTKAPREDITAVTSDIGKWIFFSPAFLSTTAIERGIAEPITDVFVTGVSQKKAGDIIQTDVKFLSETYLKGFAPSKKGLQEGIARSFSKAKPIGDKFFVAKTDVYGGIIKKGYKFPGKIVPRGEKPFAGVEIVKGMRVGDTKAYITRGIGQVKPKTFFKKKIIDFESVGVGGRFGEYGIDIGVGRSAKGITRGVGVTKDITKALELKEFDIVGRGITTGVEFPTGKGLDIIGTFPKGKIKIPPPSTALQTQQIQVEKIISKPALESTRQVIGAALQPPTKQIVSGLPAGAGIVVSKLVPRIKPQIQEQVLVSVRDFERMFGGITRPKGDIIGGDKFGDILGSSRFRPPEQGIIQAPSDTIIDSRFSDIVGVSRFGFSKQKPKGIVRVTQRDFVGVTGIPIITTTTAITQIPRERITPRYWIPQRPIQRQPPPRLRFDWGFVTRGGYFFPPPPIIPPGGVDGILFTTEAKRKFKYVPSLLPLKRYELFGAKRKRVSKRKEISGLYERELGLGKFPTIKIGSLLGDIRYSTPRSRKLKKGKKR